MFLSHFSLPFNLEIYQYCWENFSNGHKPVLSLSLFFFQLVLQVSHLLIRFFLQSHLLRAITISGNNEVDLATWFTLIVIIIITMILLLLLILITLVFSQEPNFIRWFSVRFSSDGHCFQRLSDAFCNHCLKATITDLRIQFAFCLIELLLEIFNECFPLFQNNISLEK